MLSRWATMCYTDLPPQFLQRILDAPCGISSALEFGTVWINDHLPLTSEAPHGGFKQSGFGKDLSAEAIGDYQITKHVMMAQA